MPLTHLDVYKRQSLKADDAQHAIMVAQTDIDTNKASIADTRSDVSAVQSDVTNIKGDVAHAQSTADHANANANTCLLYTSRCV